ncbi:substance-K receptor-like [Elysia marginata]|uniref:Substance-K receptor-like n=1 Tax=Elysia marginata TaxID=1093978 RepID=A0AAV4HTI7_9GAST|nr:substance-K receptor-like [Elysia marginata]
MYFIPIIVMLFTYTMVAYRLLCRKLVGTHHADGKMSHQEMIKRKITKMLVVVLGVFIVFWTPQQVMLLYLAINQVESDSDSHIPTLRFVALYLAYFGSAINPYLYAGLNENFRRGFVDSFRCLLRANRIDPDIGATRSQHPARPASHTILSGAETRNHVPPSANGVTQNQFLTVQDRDCSSSVKATSQQLPGSVSTHPTGTTPSSTQDAPHGMRSPSADFAGPTSDPRTRHNVCRPGESAL